MSLVFATTFFFCFFFCGFFIGGGGGVLRHSAVQTDFEFEISGPLCTRQIFLIKNLGLGANTIGVISLCNS